MKFEELLQYIPEEELNFLSAETGVDRQAKKLKGSVMFKLVLYSLLECGKPSQRVMESYFSSARFRALSGMGPESIRHSSISERISVMKSEYFERIFELLFDRFNGVLGEKAGIQRFDSTMVAISGRLVSWGMRVGRRTDKVQLKYTVGMQGSLPCTFRVYREQEHLSEDLTIPAAILSYRHKGSGIAVFDRGVQARETLAGFAGRGVVFVCRLKTDARFRTEETSAVPARPEDCGVELDGDMKVRFFVRGKREPPQTVLRVVRGRIAETGEEILFLTNNFELGAYEVAEIYRKRWEIEVFFRFLKQELNLSHLVSRSPNGIRVMMYITLILAMLIIVYKKTNNRKGYKIVKINIANELEKHLIREIVILSGGNPDRVAHYIGDP